MSGGSGYNEAFPDTNSRIYVWGGICQGLEAEAICFASGWLHFLLAVTGQAGE